MITVKDIFKAIVAILFVFPCFSVFTENEAIGIVSSLFGLIWGVLLYYLSYKSFGKNICRSYYRVHYKIFGSIKG